MCTVLNVLCVKHEIRMKSPNTVCYNRSMRYVSNQKLLQKQLRIRDYVFVSETLKCSNRQYDRVKSAARLCNVLSDAPQFRKLSKEM